jgi:hypothetical protein
MTATSKKDHQIQGDPWDSLDTGWGSEADYFHRMTGESVEYCKDCVILRYLMAGDTRPLAALMMSGRAPGPAVLKHVSAMLQPADGTENEVPFRLNVKSRLKQKGRRRDPEKSWRDLLISKNVERILEEGGKYEWHAIPEVAAMLPNAGKAHQTVRDAYDERHPNKHSKARKLKGI